MAATFTLIIILIEICKAPTLRLKALNKRSITHIMYIEMEMLSAIKMYTEKRRRKKKKRKKKKEKKKKLKHNVDKGSNVTMPKMRAHTHTHTLL